MSQVIVITNNPPVVAACFGASSITNTVTMSTTTVGLTVSGQHDVVLLPPLILRDTVRGSIGLITVSQQQQPQS